MEIAQLSVLAGSASSAPAPPEELDGAADGSDVIFGFRVGSGFRGGGSRTGLGDSGFLDDNWAGEAFWETGARIVDLLAAIKFSNDLLSFYLDGGFIGKLSLKQLFIYLISFLLSKELI